jgi:hypothetical protein
MVELAGPGAGGAATSSAVLGDLLAVARGLTSTWAGRAPAVGPPIEATDLLQGSHRWFAVVPAAALSGTREAIDPTVATVTDLEASVAIRTAPLHLDDARAAIGALLADDGDATLYPIDD